VVGLLTDFGAALFLLPGGRPRRFVVISDIQAGGRPRVRPQLLASRSRLKIASPICSRSCRNSARILITSMCPDRGCHLLASRTAPRS